MSKARIWEITGLAVIFSLIAFFSFFHLKESPSVWYDEGIYVHIASNIAIGEGSTFQFAPGYFQNIMPSITVGYPLLYPLAIVFKIFGNHILAARLLMVFFIFGLCLAAYAFIKRKFGVFPALASVLLLATFPPLFGNGKTVLGEVPALFFFVLFLLIFDRTIDSSKKPENIWFMILGFVAGICVATKLIFLLFLIAFGLVLLWLWKQKRILLKHFLITILFASLPILVWFYIHYATVGSINTVLNFYANPYAVSSIGSLIIANIVRFLKEGGPLYLLALLAVWSFSLYVRKKERKTIYVSETLSMVFCLLVVVAYLRIVGWHRYIFPAQIISILFFPQALLVVLEKILKYLKIYEERTAKFFTFFVVALFVTAGVYSIGWNSWVAEAYKSDKTEFWENYFASSPKEKSFFFYDAPEVAILMPNRNYYQYMLLVSSGGPYGTEFLDVIKNGIVDEVIVRTDYIDGNKLFLEKYKPREKAYKYTILRRINSYAGN